MQKLSFGLHLEVTLVAQSNRISPKVVVMQKSPAIAWHIGGWMSNVGSHLSLDALKATAWFKLAHDLLGRNLELRWNCEVLFLSYLLTDYGLEVLVLQVLALSNGGWILWIIGLRGYRFLIHLFGMMFSYIHSFILFLFCSFFGFFFLLFSCLCSRGYVRIY